MTTPTTHDTRTVELTDTEIAKMAMRYSQGRPEHVRHAMTRHDWSQGAYAARSIYEPHVAKLEAERPKWVEMYEASRLVGLGWLTAKSDHSRALYLMVPPIPLPAAPTQGGGEVDERTEQEKIEDFQRDMDDDVFGGEY